MERQGVGMDELKPCPFCGGPASVIEIEDPDVAGEMLYTVWCEECGCGTVPANTPVEVRRLWNRRT